MPLRFMIRTKVTKSGSYFAGFGFRKILPHYSVLVSVSKVYDFLCRAVQVLGRHDLP